MSKAFTRESDDDAEGVPATSPALPPGAKNYMTPAGARQLRDQLQRLRGLRAEATRGTGTPDGRRQLDAIDRQIRALDARLGIAEVVDPATQRKDRVRFGATVTVREGGVEHRYRIVGLDEADPSLGHVSWLSPMAKALLNAPVAAVVTVRSPRGDRELEVVAIVYEPT